MDVGELAHRVKGKIAATPKYVGPLRDGCRFLRNASSPGLRCFPL